MIAGIVMDRRGLQESGLKVYVANNGVDGLKAIKKRLPDLAVLDIMMPRMNGYEVCVALQKDEKTANIPLIVMTALTEGESPEKDIDWREKLNVADFLSKPFGVDELVARVRKILSDS